MTTLTREQILAASDLARERVEVPEWGGAVLVVAMTAREYEEFARRWLDDRTAQGYRELLVARSLRDEEGQRIFSDADAAALAEKSAAAFNRVFLVAQRINGFGTDELASAEKN